MCIQLLPCPFCGSKPVNNDGRGIKCSYCGAEMQYELDPGKVISTKAWNSRIGWGSKNAANIAKAIHYPECWDVAAYPTVNDALAEMFAWFKCGNDDCAQLEAIKVVK